eukprot:GFYU01000763.1.p1 GENE.GFYU01000763.1~~GFYU01000763.1.p1  ORF type:complete len:183 (+),score=82.22 GFYU01000763.1:173-721(+)
MPRAASPKPSKAKTATPSKKESSPAPTAGKKRGRDEANMSPLKEKERKDTVNPDFNESEAQKVAVKAVPDDMPAKKKRRFDNDEELKERLATLDDKPSNPDFDLGQFEKWCYDVAAAKAIAEGEGDAAEDENMADEAEDAAENADGDDGEDADDDGEDADVDVEGEGDGEEEEEKKSGCSIM